MDREPEVLLSKDKVTSTVWYCMYQYIFFLTVWTMQCGGDQGWMSEVEDNEMVEKINGYK